MPRILLTLTFACVLVAAPLVSAQVNFAEQVIYSGDTSSYGITSGDFNNDGILDVVTINTSTLSFCKGIGGGRFANPVNQSITYCSTLTSELLALLPVGDPRVSASNAHLFRDAFHASVRDRM